MMKQRCNRSGLMRSPTETDQHSQCVMMSSQQFQQLWQTVHVKTSKVLRNLLSNLMSSGFSSFFSFFEDEKSNGQDKNCQTK